MGRNTKRDTHGKQNNIKTSGDADKKIIFSACAMALIPLLVHISIVKNRVFGAEWYSGNDTEIDVFLVVKTVSIIVLAVLMLGVLCFDIIVKGNYRTIKIAGILLAAYGLLVIISSAVSSAKERHGSEEWHSMNLHR